MAPSSKAKKRGGRRKSSSSLAYQHITYNRETGIFTIRVKGHTRTATSDALALWERDQMFKEYADERLCVVCGDPFKPDKSLTQTICSDECQSRRSASSKRVRNRRVHYVERYLYTREGAWIVEPYDAHLGVRLKATFQTEEEARDYIDTVMTSTRPWRERECRVCGRRFDFYEEKLFHNATACRSCGGAEYRYVSGKWTRRKPLLTQCRTCGVEIVNTTVQTRAYCVDCGGDPALG